MPVLSVSDLSISFSGPPVIENANLHIDRGERVCVLGRNGAGKSTLLKVIAGAYGPDRGSITFPEGGAAAALPQEIDLALDGNVHEVVTRGFGADGESLLRLQAGQPHGTLDPDKQWQMETQVTKTIKELELDATAPFAALSGGLKRRALLGKAIVSEPSLLILDEPTNHLDLESILWLEEFLLKSKLTVLFVTHDRAFLKRLANRIVEIDLGQLNSFRCSYDTYLERKEELLEIEATNRAAFEKKLSQEEAWLRKGIKARRTRNEGRVKALKKMRDERRAWRSRDGNASFALQGAQASGAKVVTAQAASATFGEKAVLRPFDIEVMRGDRIGVIGPNGSGKTTLLKLLLGQLPPDAGSVEHGTKLSIAYFDQMRGQLDDSKTVFDNVADGSQSIVINGKSRHVITYLQDFLFTPDRAQASLRTLSGGERNRLMLAKLFAQAANLLVLDEPTNDLDSETLELLEERILEYDGTLILVSHDRAFLENTVTSLIVLDGRGGLQEHSGGYEDWSAKRSQSGPKPSASNPSKPNRSNWKKKERKFSNKERRELESLPSQIESLDAEKEAIAQRLADPALYQSDGAEVTRLKADLEAIEGKLEQSYSRWEELESIRTALSGSDQ